jgi:hypothetical protein
MDSSEPDIFSMDEKQMIEFTKGLWIPSLYAMRMYSQKTIKEMEDAKKTFGNDVEVMLSFIPQDCDEYKHCVDQYLELDIEYKENIRKLNMFVAVLSNEITIKEASENVKNKNDKR